MTYVSAETIIYHYLNRIGDIQILELSRVLWEFSIPIKKNSITFYLLDNLIPAASFSSLKLFRKSIYSFGHYRFDKCPSLTVLSDDFSWRKSLKVEPPKY